MSIQSTTTIVAPVPRLNLSKVLRQTDSFDQDSAHLGAHNSARIWNTFFLPRRDVADSERSSTSTHSTIRQLDEKHIESLAKGLGISFVPIPAIELFDIGEEASPSPAVDEKKSALGSIPTTPTSVVSGNSTLQSSTPAASPTHLKSITFTIASPSPTVRASLRNMQVGPLALRHTPPLRAQSASTSPFDF